MSPYNKMGDIKMKKIIPVLMLTALLLEGCGLAEQTQTVNEKYIEPAVSSAQTQTDETETEAYTGPDVHTDSSALTDYLPAESMYSRLSDGSLSELAPSEGYGTLLPYLGAYYDQGGDGSLFGKYGLVTESGMIVLDPVLTSVGLACYYSGGENVMLDIYIMAGYVENEDGSAQTKYAVAGKDGSWVTGFDYYEVIAMEPGVLCVRDSATNDAVCYAEDGSVVFDTTNFADLWRLAPDSITSLADYSEGYMRICYSNGQYGFMDTDGDILNRYVDRPSYLDGLRPFSEGLAAVQIYDQWNYIDTDGVYAIYGTFDEAGDFKNGVAVVKKDGIYSVIDPENTVLAEFPDAETVTAYDRYVYVKNTDGTEFYFLTPDLTQANLYDKELHFCSEGYWVVGANGVRMLTFTGVEIYFSGTGELLSCSGNGLYLMKLVDGKLAVMDEYSRVIVTDGTDIGFVTDSETGEAYVYKYDGEGTSLYTASGVLAAEGVILRGIGTGYNGPETDGNYGPQGGLIMCTDDFTSGLKNMSNNWVFRINVDIGD
ncbi:MAG: WG repeat-containing protein [Clostridia bacterium]|nr:WG repeat-containing protein [Clostridia bacterium]